MWFSSSARSKSDSSPSRPREEYSRARSHRRLCDLRSRISFSDAVRFPKLDERFRSLEQAVAGVGDKTEKDEHESEQDVDRRHVDRLLALLRRRPAHEAGAEQR